MVYWRPKEVKYVINRERMEADIVLTIEFKEKADLEEFSEKSKTYELSGELFEKLANLLAIGFEKLLKKETPPWIV